MFKKITLTCLLALSFSTLNAEASETVTDIQSYKEYINTVEVAKDSWTAYPESQAQMNYLVQQIYLKAPSKVVLKSKSFDRHQLKEMYHYSNDNMNNYKMLPYKFGLLNYSIVMNGDSVILYDNSVQKGNPSAKAVISGLDLLTDHLAEELKGETEIESVTNLSKYIFDNFEYTADGYYYMTAANLHNKEMACQGISLLGQMVLDKMGITNEVRLGDSHFWIVVTTKDGGKVTVDPTTDILLGEPNSTLGLSTEDHILKSSWTNMYDARFAEGKYEKVETYFETKFHVKH